MRNNTNYMETAVLSGLELTAKLPPGDPRELLQEEPQLHRVGEEGRALRLT